MPFTLIILITVAAILLGVGLIMCVRIFLRLMAENRAYLPKVTSVKICDSYINSEFSEYYVKKITKPKTHLKTLRPIYSIKAGMESYNSLNVFYAEN